MSKTHWRTLYNPDYLGAYALVNSTTGKYADIIATIASVRVENVVGADGKREDCMVMRFVERDTKPMIVNATNAKMMEKLFHTPIIEDWAGRKIQIGVESVKAFGDVVDALRIRKFLPREQELPKCYDCSGEIGATEKLNAAQMVAYGQRKYGAPLCADCIKKRMEAAQEDARNEEPVKEAQEVAENDQNPSEQ